MDISIVADHGKTMYLEKQSSRNMLQLPCTLYMETKVSDLRNFTLKDRGMEIEIDNSNGTHS